MIFIEDQIRLALERDKKLARYERYAERHKGIASARSMQWQKDNRDRYNKNSRKRYSRDMIAESGSNYTKELRRRALVEKRALSRKPPIGHAESVRQYRLRNMASYARRQRERYANKLHASPSWSQKSLIQEFYIEAARLTRETGIRHEVDHIVPLKSPLVCGLHVVNNLQILSRSLNASKNNKLLDVL